MNGIALTDEHCDQILYPLSITEEHALLTKS